MTEKEWQSSDAAMIIRLLEGKMSDRKMRLVACACCRRVWDKLTDERSRRAVEGSEFAADNEMDETLLDGISAAAYEAFEDACHTPDAESDDVLIEQLAAASEAASYASNTPIVRVEDIRVVMLDTVNAVQDSLAELTAHADLLRDIFGNPFRPIAFDPAWRSETAVGIARGIYEDRAFERMPILADALQDAGCEDEQVLSHCREPGTHVRGCWVVDLVLGKE